MNPVKLILLVASVPVLALMLAVMLVGTLSFIENSPLQLLLIIGGTLAVVFTIRTRAQARMRRWARESEE